MFCCAFLCSCVVWEFQNAYWLICCCKMCICVLCHTCNFKVSIAKSHAWFTDFMLSHICVTWKSFTHTCVTISYSQSSCRTCVKSKSRVRKTSNKCSILCLHIQINSISYSGLGRLKHLGKLKSLNKGRICFLWSLHWQEIQFDFFICSALFIFLFHHHHV